MEPFNELLMFRRFRLNVIRFLRLPDDVNEGALRAAMKSSSDNLLASYDERAARVKPHQRLRSTRTSGNRGPNVNTVVLPNDR